MATFNGTGGADTLAGSAGADTLIGGAGNDTYIMNSLGDRIVEAANGGIDLVIASVLDANATASLAPWAQVENLRYSGAAAASLIGNALSNRIDANAATATADRLSGGIGNDSLFGYRGDDLLNGGTGNDLLDGGTGADSMIGGTGNDVYVVESALDRIAELAGGGRDRVQSTFGFNLGQDWANQIEDLTYTGATAATLTGNDLGNAITSNSATADSLVGGAGNDTLNGGAGNDTLRGGTGDDYYIFAAGDVVIEAAGEGRDTFQGIVNTIANGANATTIENLIYTGTGNATLTGNNLENVIEGGSANDVINAANGNDSLAGGTGADRLNGGAGNDRLFGGSIPGLTIDRGRVNDTVADTLAGGTGDDTYVVSDMLDVVSEGVSEGTLDVVLSGVSNTLTRYANVEALVLEDQSGAYSASGGTGNDILIGNNSDNLVAGGLGNDTLSGWGLATGAGSADHLIGAAGDDVLLAFAFAGTALPSGLTLDGGNGNDLYVIGPNMPVAGWDTGGSDTAVILGSGSAAALSGVENIYLYGANGATDIAARTAILAAYAALTGGAVFNTSALAAGINATGNDLANTIVGNLLNNSLSGGAGNDTINGGNGNDTLNGGTGTDSLIGGHGNDSYHVDSATDVVSEAGGSGFDLIYSATNIYSSTFASTYVGVEGFVYTGTTGVVLDSGFSTNTNDYIGGGSGNDTINGNGGNDTIFGGLGNDSLKGDDGNDTVHGGDGDDYLSSGIGTNAMYGENGSDTLFGDVGNDLLDGGNGNDVLNGVGGNDTLYGGAGDDLIRFGEFTLDVARNGDLVFGDDPTNANAIGADTFIFTMVTAANGVSETSPGSGVFHYANGSTVADFQQGVDRFAIDTSGVPVGDLDTVIDGTSTVTTQGASFSATDELVFFQANVSETFAPTANAIFDPILMNQLTSVIGTADANIAVNETRVYVFDDGASSAVFLFQSNNGDANVTGDELYLLAVVSGTDTLQASDFLFI